MIETKFTNENDDKTTFLTFDPLRVYVIVLTATDKGRCYLHYSLTHWSDLDSSILKL